MSGDHTPVSLDFIKEWREMLLQEGPYVLISDWMQRMGKTDADFNKQAIITADETDNLSENSAMMSSQGGYKISLIWLPERMNLTSANKILKLLEEPPRQDTLPPGKRAAGTAARNHQKPCTAYRLQED